MLNYTLDLTLDNENGEDLGVLLDADVDLNDSEEQVDRLFEELKRGLLCHQ